jgi:hypothetical protein
VVEEARVLNTLLTNEAARPGAIQALRLSFLYSPSHGGAAWGLGSLLLSSSAMADCSARHCLSTGSSFLTFPTAMELLDQVPLKLWGHRSPTPRPRLDDAPPPGLLPPGICRATRKKKKDLPS